MCEATTITAVVSALAAAGGTAASYVGAKRAQNAQDEAAMRETMRQRRIQQTQSSLIAQQEAEKEKGRKAYAELQPQVNRENTDAMESAATEQRNAAYQQAIQQTGADPSQGGAQAAVVDTQSEQPIAVRRGYEKASAEGKQFSQQQAGARAFLDALNDAQQQAGIKLARGAEKIGMHGDFVQGLTRPLNAWEQAKNGQAVFQAQSAAAAQQGADAVAQGQLLSSLGQLGYAYGTRPTTPQGTATVRTISQRPIT